MRKYSASVDSEYTSAYQYPRGESTKMALGFTRFQDKSRASWQQTFPRRAPTPPEKLLYEIVQAPSEDIIFFS